MGPRDRLVILSLFVFLVFQIVAGPGKAAEEGPAALILTCQKGQLILESRGAPLERILKELDQTCSVKLTGLETKGKDPIKFTLRGVGLEEGMKQFLRHLGEKNYVLQFVDENLRFVSVFPEAVGDGGAPPARPTEEGFPEAFSTVVGVVGVVEGSQAESSGLVEGDLIIEYDGVRVASTRHLIEEVEKKSLKERVEMVVVRDSVPRR